jgi:hypothetical protein
MSRDGGTGRRSGLKIPLPARPKEECENHGFRGLSSTKPNIINSLNTNISNSTKTEMRFRVHLEKLKAFINKNLTSIAVNDSGNNTCIFFRAFSLGKSPYLPLKSPFPQNG